MHQLALKEITAKKASLTFGSRSKMHLEVNELHYIGRRQAAGSKPLYTDTDKRTEKHRGK